jgi:hypothetical protein
MVNGPFHKHGRGSWYLPLPQLRNELNFFFFVLALFYPLTLFLSLIVYVMYVDQERSGFAVPINLPHFLKKKVHLVPVLN